MRNMLVIEDQDLMRESVMEIVKDEYRRAKVMGAQTLPKALQLLSESDYQLIVLDPGLPGYDPGSPSDRLAVVEATRAAAPDAAIIILTGLDSPTEAVAFRSCRVAAYASKTGLSREKMRLVLREVSPNAYPVRLSDVTDCAEVALRGLTAREREVAAIIRNSPRSKKREELFKEIAVQLGIQIESARTYYKRVKRKMKLGGGWQDDT